MSSNLGAAGVGEQGMQSLFPCSSHTIRPRAVEVNTAEEEERKSNSTGERRCLEDIFVGTHLKSKQESRGETVQLVLCKKLN